MRDAPDSRNFTVVVKSDADRTGQTVSYIFITERVSQQYDFFMERSGLFNKSNMATLTSVIQ